MTPELNKIKYHRQTVNYKNRMIKQRRKSKDKKGKFYIFSDQNLLINDIYFDVGYFKTKNLLKNVDLKKHLNMKACV